MTIAPWEREKFRRATEDRGTKDRGATELYLFSVPGSRYYELRPNPPKKEPVVLDEMRITPSKQFRDQDTVRQAKSALAQAKAGKRVTDGDIERMQQRLLSIDRQKALAGREPEGRQLVEQLAEVRRSNLVGKALDTLAKAKKAHVAERSIENLQKQLLSMERQDQMVGREGEGQQFTIALSEVRRSQLVDEATRMLARGHQGPRLDPRAIDKLQQRLLGMERQDELLGRPSEGRQLAEALGAMRRSQLIAEAQRMVARAKQGQKFSNEQINKLQQLLVGMERQEEMRGDESEGVRLATALAELRH